MTNDTAMIQRGEMEYHEIANLFPMLDGEEYERFREDIACNGQIEPIWTYQGKIIDGRNRYRACVDLGVTPHFKEWHGNGSLAAFVVSLNIHRRHLTSSQRAVVALDILPVLEAEAKARMLAGKKFDPVQKVVQGSGKSSEQAADMLGTNRQYVSDAKKIKEQAPELLEQVRSGELSLKEATNKVKHKERTAPVEEYHPKFVGEGAYDDLMFGIVKQAIIDAANAKRGDTEPTEWLLSDDCAQYFETLSIPFDIVRDWINSGCIVKRTDELIIDCLEKIYKQNTEVGVGV